MQRAGLERADERFRFGVLLREISAAHRNLRSPIGNGRLEDGHRQNFSIEHDGEGFIDIFPRQLFEQCRPCGIKAYVDM